MTPPRIGPAHQGRQPSLTPMAIEILHSLGRYRFMTTEQLVRLGVSKHLDSCRKAINTRLIDHKPALAQAMRYGVNTCDGKIPYLYYLTPPGARLVAEHSGLDISILKFPAQKPPRSDDYKHRLGIVDIQMAFETACADKLIELTRFDSYYDTKGANYGASPDGRLRHLSTITLGGATFSPDANILISRPLKQPLLYTVELERNFDTGRTIRKCIKHAECLSTAALAIHYDIPTLPWRALIVMETQAAMTAAYKRFTEDEKFAAVAPYFAFHVLDELIHDVTQGWRFLDGKTRSLL